MLGGGYSTSCTKIRVYLDMLPKVDSDEDSCLNQLRNTASSRSYCQERHNKKGQQLLDRIGDVSMLSRGQDLNAACRGQSMEKAC